MITSNTIIYDVAPTGRMSAKKLKQFASDINEMLTLANAKQFVELGQRYGYYAVDELGVSHKAWRDGDRENDNSGIARTYSSGLTGKQAKQSMIDAYYDFVSEVY